LSGVLGGKERRYLVEIKHLTEEYIDSLIQLQKNNEKEFKHFTPHPFTREKLQLIIETAKLDLFYVVIFEGSVIGYGILRGMDEGYKVPSLGIAIDKNYYGTGVGSLLMDFLETTAKVHGYKKMRLRVYKNNERAYPFYLKLGYKYEPYDKDSVLGFKEL
jgi:ribosomal protein S18 acetylase RimI-like enzyme